MIEFNRNIKIIKLCSRELEESSSYYFLVSICDLFVLFVYVFVMCNNQNLKIECNITRVLNLYNILYLQMGPKF